MPKRIQRRRTKRWKLPEGAVCVTRPGKWGNPFEVGKHGNRERCVKLYRLLAAGYFCLSFGTEHVTLQEQARKSMGDAAKELRGKDLACYCSLDQPCHAEVLLELANQ
jgi:hypothetical protein